MIHFGILHQEGDVPPHVALAGEVDGVVIISLVGDIHGCEIRAIREKIEVNGLRGDGEVVLLGTLTLAAVILKLSRNRAGDPDPVDVPVISGILRDRFDHETDRLVLLGEIRGEIVENKIP